MHGMGLVLAATLAFAMSAMAPPVQATAKNVPALTPGLRDALQAADALDREGDPARTLAALEEVASHPDFPSLDRMRQAAILRQAAITAIDAGQLPRAYPLAQAAVDAYDDDPDAWFLLAQLAANQQDHAAAAVAFTHMARRWPEFAGAIPAGTVNPLLIRLGFSAGPQHDLLEALHAANWTIDGIAPDHAWARLALMRGERGDIAGARSVLAKLASPSILVWVHSDRRFDAIVDPDAPLPDPAQALELEIQRLVAAAAAQPSSLAPLRELGYVLLMAGREEDALDIAAEAIASPSSFEDASDLPWMYNQRAIALRRLDRTDEALKALTEAAALDEHGSPNVSQSLNLAHLLVDLQRPRDALDVLARVDGMSGYGLLVLSMARLRAHAQLGFEEDAAQALERIRDGREDGPTIWLEALLWSGRMDEAAGWLAGLLSNPDRRAEALEWCQDYLTATPLPGRVPLVEARRTLLARADVRAAIDAVGRVGSPGLYESVGID